MDEEKPNKDTVRQEKRIAEYAKMPAAQAFEGAAGLAAAVAHRKMLEIDKGSKVTRKERSEMLRNMSAAVQAAANIGYRIKQGIAPDPVMMESAMQQPDTLSAEIAAAADHNRELAQQVAAAAGLENLAADLASVATASPSSPSQQGPNQQEPVEKSAAANPPADAAATLSPPQLVANKPAGRPSSYTDQEADAICAWIQQGKSLNSYCKAHGRQASTIYGWMRESVYFTQNYASAHADRADTLVEDMLEIADSTETAGDIVQVMSAKLRIDARKWIAERMRPEKYGAKVQVDTAATVTFNLGVPSRDAQQIIDINPVQGDAKPG